MDLSRRAVDAYRRSRMIDNATANDDKVTPIYRLDEICNTLRSSHVSVVKEMSDYILKRLDHKSPLVKQKTLRLIKYSTGKAGAEFKKEMQRQSGALCQLFHYRGQADVLKGDAVNKAVRDTAHEAVAVIFASDDKPASCEEINKRTQGFGNTHFEMSPDERKTFLGEVVGFGGASIRQGLSTIIGSHSAGKGNSNGSYEGPSLQESLSLERDTFERDERQELSSESQFSVDGSEHTGLNQARLSSQEERLLNAITESGGVRLQPSRESIQSFHLEASKLDAMVLSHALEVKLQSHSWQVRFKAICVLESILRQRKDKCFEAVAIFFEENNGAVVTCTESPQTSLREKANRVLGLLVDKDTVGVKTTAIRDTNKVTRPVIVEMPDLIDTSGTDILVDGGTSQEKSIENTKNVTTSALLDVGDLLGDNLLSFASEGDPSNTEDDPFAGMSIHTSGAVDSDTFGDVYATIVDIKSGENEVNEASNEDETSLFSGLVTNIQQIHEKPIESLESLADLVGSLSVNESGSGMLQRDLCDGNSFNASGVGLKVHQNHPMQYQTLGSMQSSQVMGINPSLPYPMGSMQYNLPSNMVLHQAFASQAMNFGAMGNSFAQQQLLATMANFQQFGKGANFGNAGFLYTEAGTDRGLASSFSDSFLFTDDPTQSCFSTTETSRNEETRAFDFISEHISAAYAMKKVT